MGNAGGKEVDREKSTETSKVTNKNVTSVVESSNNKEGEERIVNAEGAHESSEVETKAVDTTS